MAKRAFENEKAPYNNISKVLMVLFATFALSLGAFIFISFQSAYGSYGLNKPLPVDDVMLSAGYANTDGKWLTVRSGVPVMIEFDYKDNICKKNDYCFFIEPVMRSNTPYLDRGTLEKILTSDITPDGSGGYLTEPRSYSSFQWEKYPVIAHAGGAYRTGDEIYYYSNSHEALVQNYSLGCRVFEFDIFPTSDDKLALVHDWRVVGNDMTEPISSLEWLSTEIYGDRLLDGGLTPMLLDDLLDEMLVNPDMFIVTDTKSNLYTADEARHHFEIICSEAAKRDPSLLNRIIPQVYDAETYEIVRSVYHFPGMIFTCYSTPWKGKDIVEFCSKHDDIKAVTAQHSISRLSGKSIQRLHDLDISLFYHTVYTYEELAACFEGGADGVYTGVFTPEDIYNYGLLPRP